MKQASGQFKGLNHVTVTGLGFRPKLVLGHVIGPGSWSYGTVFYAIEGNAYSSTSSNGAVELGFSFTDDGFVLNGNFSGAGLYAWTAYSW